MTTGLREGTAAEAGLSKRQLDHVSDLAAEWVKDGIHPALVVLVARHGVWQWSASRFPLARAAILQSAGGSLLAPASQLLLLGWPFLSRGGHVLRAAERLRTGSLPHGSDQLASIA